MKAKLTKHGYKLLAFAGFVLWISETAYFGWNMTAQSGMEKMLDQVALIMMGYGISGDIAKQVKIHRHITKNYEVNTDKIIFDHGKEILQKIVEEQARKEQQDLLDRLSGKEKTDETS